MIKKLFFPAVLLFLGLGFWLHGGSVGASFVANDLIDDGVFDNSTSMTAAQIDTWLNNTFPSSCISTNNGFTAPDPTGYTPQTGYTYGSYVSAGHVVADASQAYGINPQVILATLEKESSVVTGAASYHCQYINTAMGYDCPDSGSCPQNPATESGFTQQIIHAAWMLKFHEERSEGNTSWNVQLNNAPQTGDHWDNSDDPQACYSGRMTQGVHQICPSGGSNYYDGLTTIDGTGVHMDTGATAALYDYTPHFHGNQLFVGYFEQWFGSTVGELVRTTANAQVYIVNPDTATKYPINTANIMNDFGSLGLRYVDDAYLNQFTVGAALGNFVQSPDGTLYLVNADIRLPFSSCVGDVVDYGYTCASGQYTPLTTGQINKLSSGPGVTNLIKSNTDGTIYYLTGGQKRPITSWSDFLSFQRPYNVFTSALVGRYGVGNYIYGLGSLAKTPSAGTVYVVKDGSHLIPLASFSYTQDLGLNSTVETMSDTTFQQNYNSASGAPNLISSKVKCGSTYYVGTNGTTYPLNSTLMTAYGFNAADFMDFGSICSNLKFSPQNISQYIRVPDGSIYYVSAGQKRAFTSYALYQSASYCNNSCVLTQASNSFAGTIPSGAYIQ